VAYILRLIGKSGVAVWFLLLVISLSSRLGAEEGRSRAIAPGRAVSEEDLPADEEQPPLTVWPAESAPVSLQSAIPADALPAVLAPPLLPTNAELSPQDVAALRFVEDGKNALSQDEIDRAREQFERAVAIAPSQPYGYYFLGRVAFVRGEHKQALAFLRKAELLFAQSDQAWLGETASLQGAVYEDLGDYTQARVAYQRCLQLLPANLKALSALARLAGEERLPSEPLSQ
jgi:tetratricopeptide (TPR) repeat protein